MPKTNIIRELERSLNEKLPDSIGKILTEAGFNSKSAISKLNNTSSIRSIEKYVQDNPEDFRDILKNTIFKNIEIFKFRPGHEAILLSLPEELTKIENKKGVNRPQKRRYSEIDTNKQSTADSSINLESPNSELSEKKDELIKKIQKFAEKQSIAIGELSGTNVLNLRFQNAEFKCSVQCPHCPKRVPCNKKKYWAYGNFADHLKTHKSSAERQQVVHVGEIIAEELQPNELSEDSQIQIIKKTTVTDEEFRNILNFTDDNLA